MIDDIFEELDKMKNNRVNLTTEFLAETGEATRVTRMLERAATALGSDPKQAATMLEALKNKNPEFAFLLASHLTGEEITDEGLQGKIVNILKEGVKRSEAGEQLEQRARLMASVSGRVASGYTWVRPEQIEEITRPILEGNPGRMRDSGLEWRGKIEGDQEKTRLR